MINKKGFLISLTCHVAMTLGQFLFCKKVSNTYPAL